MGLLDRSADILSRRVDRLLDDLDDPAERREYTYERLQDELRDVDDAIVALVTERKRLERRRAALDERIDEHNERAREAVADDREDLAREVLSRKQADLTRLEDVDARLDELRGIEDDMKARRGDLKERIDRFRAERAEQDARRTAAEAEANVTEALSGDPQAGSTETGRRVSDALDRVDETEARAAALEELREEGFFDDGPDVESELTRARIEADVESELDVLRREVRDDEDDGRE